MTPYNNISFTHALVLQFLESNNYNETLEAFHKEAKETIELFNNNNDNDNNQSTLSSSQSLTFKPLTSIIQDYLVTELQKDFNNLYFERKIDDDLITPGNQELLPCYLYKTFSEIHNSNLLNVKTQNIDVKRLLVDDGEYQITQTPTIVTGSADKSVKFTSLLTGETFNILEFHKAGVLSIDFHPIYKNIMLTSSIDSTCALIDVTNMEVIQPFKDHKKYVIKAKFSPDGNFIVTASYDHTINIYKTKTIDNNKNNHNNNNNSTITDFPPQYIKVHSILFGGNVESFCFLPDNQYIIVGVRNDNYLHYINLLNNFEDKKYNMNANGDDWVSFTPMDISPSPNNDGKYLLVSTDDENGRIMLFRTHSAQQIYNYYDDISDNRKFTNPNHCWHPSGKYFFTYGVDSIIRIFDVVTNKVVVKLHGHKNLVRGLWYDDERQLLITCGFDKTVKVWGHDQSLSLEKNNNNNDNNKDIIN